MKRFLGFSLAGIIAVGQAFCPVRQGTEMPCPMAIGEPSIAISAPTATRR
jgi:hypothetical protein